MGFTLNVYSFVHASANRYRCSYYTKYTNRTDNVDVHITLNISTKHTECRCSYYTKYTNTTDLM
jgi:hypothetical protein